MRIGTWWMMVLAIGALVAVARAEEPAVIKLWPEGAPGAKGNAEQDQPSITAFLPAAEKATGAALVLCPGGGYGMLAAGHEGVDVAKFLNGHGVAVFMLKYRLGSHGYQHPVPLQDCQRALRMVRARAGEWKVSPERVGLMGFSAGGHLASTAGTHFDSGKSDATDPIERVSCRPDLLVLCYPVVMFGSPYTHTGSEMNLLGRNPKGEVVEELANEKHVTANTPPTFLFHTNEDAMVLPENSVHFYLALRKHKVPAELHIYQKGVHGVGLAANVKATNTWSDRLLDWLRGYGWVK